MDTLVGEKLAMFETAGALKGGRRTWVMARIPGEFRIAGDDVVQPYVLLTNSHDGTSGVRIIPTTVRVVCQNTLNLALRGASASEGLSMVHTDSLDRRIGEARLKLGIVTKRLEEFSAQAQILAKKKMSAAELSAYFTKLVADRSEKQQKKLLERFICNFENERNTLKGMKGSVWAAYNAVSEFADHEIAVHGKDELTRLDNRVNSMWFGAANKMKQQAFEAAFSMAV